jgi:hypothetical protein
LLYCRRKREHFQLLAQTTLREGFWALSLSKERKAPRAILRRTIVPLRHDDFASISLSDKKLHVGEIKPTSRR